MQTALLVVQAPLAAVPGHHQDLGALRSASSMSQSEIVSDPCLDLLLSHVRDCPQPVFHSVGDKHSTPCDTATGIFLSAVTGRVLSMKQVLMYVSHVAHLIDGLSESTVNEIIARAKLSALLSCGNGW